MKRKLILILTLLLSLCLVFSLGCSCNEEGSKQENPEQSITYGVNFIDPPQTMRMGDLKKLMYTVGAGADASTVTFDSSNTSVVMVDENAYLDAINEGQAVITARCGEEKAEFTVNVVKSDLLSQFLFSSYIDNKVTLTKAQTFDFGGYVFYNGREFAPTQVEYKTNVDGVVSISADGTVTALNKGEVVVTVTASWRNQDSPLLVKQVTVEVIDDMQILLDDGNVAEVNIYTAHEAFADTHATSFSVAEKAKFIVNGEDLTASTTFEIVDNKAILDENVPAVNFSADKVITSNAYGSAKLRATATKGEETYVATTNVNVERPVVDLGTVYYSDMDGALITLDGEDVDYNEVLSTNWVSFIQAYQGGSYKKGTQIKVEDNKVVDFAFKDINVMQDDELYLYTLNAGVKAKVKACTKVINDLTDLNALSVESMPASGVSEYIYGYYLVAKDIKWDGQFVAAPKFRAWNLGNETRFNGTLDGQNHTIEYGVSAGGLFGSLWAGRVQDVSLIVKKVVCSNTNGYASNGAILAQYLNSNSKLQNVYATYDIEDFNPDLTKGYNCVGFAGFSNGGSFTNVVLDMTKVQGVQDLIDNKTLNNYGTIFSERSTYGNPGTLKDVYVISSVKELTAGSASGIVVNIAENDTLVGVTPKKGITRFATYGDAWEYFGANGAKLQAFDAIVDTSKGFPFAFGDDKEHLVENSIRVKVDGEFTSNAVFDVAENSEKVVELDYFGEAQEITLTHNSGKDVVNIIGSTMSYAKNTVGPTEELKITATVKGVDIERLIKIAVKLPLIGSMDVDTDGTAIVYKDAEGKVDEADIPATTDLFALYSAELEGKNITKLMDLDTTTVFYEDGAITDANFLKGKVVNDPTTNKVTAIAYDGENALGSVEITVYAQFISRGEDLKSVYKSGTSNTDANIVDGYFLVVKDIGVDSDDQPIKVTPGFGGIGAGSRFCGIFDGQGHTIKYKVERAGLFGIVTDKKGVGTVKNASFVVTSVPSSKANATDAILGSYIQRGVIENVYATYECKVTPSIAWNLESTTGLFTAADSARSEFTNVIVDLSNVSAPVVTTDTTKTVTFGAPFATRRIYETPTAANYNIIWSTKEMFLYRGNNYGCWYAVAENEDESYTTSYTTYTTHGKLEKKVYKGVFRYDTLAKLAESKAQVGSFKVTSTGVTWSPVPATPAE